MKIRKIMPDEVTFTVEALDEEVSPRGYFASGDEEQDKADEGDIIRRLEAGNIWAWCCVKVTATLTLVDGSTLKGVDYLGACSYDSEKDFCLPGGYFDDMKAEALDDLQRHLENQITRGHKLAELYAEKPAKRKAAKARAR